MSELFLKHLYTEEKVEDLFRRDNADLSNLFLI